MKRLSWKHPLVAVAVITAAAMLSSCIPGPANDDVTPLLEQETGQKLAPYATVDAPLATGAADTTLKGATPDGYAAALTAAGISADGTGTVPMQPPAANGTAGASSASCYNCAIPGNHCPSVRDPAMPPCTDSAGRTGMYGNAAYLCVVGVGKIWGLQFGSLRTCMDAALVNRSDTIYYKSVYFYEADLYKYWRYAQENLAHWWALVDIFKVWWVANATLLATPWVCSLFVAGLPLDALGGALAGSACGTAAGVVIQELFG